MNVQKLLNLIKTMGIVVKQNDLKSDVLYKQGHYYYSKNNIGEFFFYQNKTGTLHTHETARCKPNRTINQMIIIEGDMSDTCFGTKNIFGFCDGLDVELIRFGETNKEDYFNTALQHNIKYTYEELMELNKEFIKLENVICKIKSYLIV